MKLIPKYQNEGLVTRQDNTYVTKPTIPPKLIKRTYTPTQSYVSQDNRSEWQREQGSKKADKEYKKYVEDKKMQQGLENLNGFLNFVDAATITTGVGKGLSLIGKSVGKQIAKGMVSREFRRQSRNLPTPSNILPNNIGWGPKQSIHVVHDTHTPSKLQLYNPERWDAVHEDAPKVGIWYQGKLGNPRTAANHSIPGKAEKAAKARERFAKRPYRIEGDLELERPIITVGDVPNRVALERAADKMNADGVVFNNVYDNGYSNNQVIFSFKEGLTNQLVKRKINGRASDYLSRARIGDILRESDYITPDNKSYKLPDYATPNSPKEPLDLHSDRLIKGGFDNIPATVNGKTKFRVGRNAWNYRSPSQFYNVHYYDREPQQYLDNMVQDMHVVNDENPADLLYKVANYAKDTDAQATASSGNIYIGKDGMFKIFNEYGGNPKNIRRVISHEVDHAIHIPAEPPRGFDTGYIDKHISQPGYFSNKNGTELAARGSQLKDYYGLDDPNQEITEDMLRYAAENYVKDTKLDNNMGLFFKSITDWKEAAKWLSKYATIAGVPITINNKTK